MQYDKKFQSSVNLGLICTKWERIRIKVTLFDSHYATNAYNYRTHKYAMFCNCFFFCFFLYFFIFKKYFFHAFFQIGIYTKCVPFIVMAKLITSPIRQEKAFTADHTRVLSVSLPSVASVFTACGDPARHMSAFSALA